jgi:hypothetical protein
MDLLENYEQVQVPVNQALPMASHERPWSGSPVRPLNNGPTQQGNYMHYQILGLSLNHGHSLYFEVLTKWL